MIFIPDTSGAGEDDNTWNEGTNNWSSEGGDKSFLEGDWVVFSDDSKGGDITVATDSAASQMDVTAGNWVFDGDINVDATSWKGTPATPTAADGKLHISGSSTSVTLKGGRYSFANGIDNNGRLIIDQSPNQTLSAVISGSGSLVKVGLNTLTLTGANTYTGPTIVNGGTLALDANGSIASSSLYLGSAGQFDISTANGNATVAGFEVAAGSRLATGGNNLDLTGNANVVFDLAGITASGETVLNVTGVGVEVDADTKIALKNAASTLSVNDYVTLASKAAGTASADPVTSGRWKFGLEVTGGELRATITGLNAFVAATNDYLGAAAPGNFNI